MNSSIRVVLFLSALLVCALQLSAQSSTIQGTVVDPQGGLIVNAKVIAFDESKGVVAREAISGSDGVFQLQPLLRGTYTIRVEMSGFKTLERKGIVLDPSSVMNLGNLKMDLGATVESIVVQEVVPLVETTTSNKSFVLSSQQVSEIALNGRDFQTLLRTLPGVVSNDRTDFRLAFNNTDAFNVNGLRGSMNNVYLDGSINTDVGANDGQYTQLSMDAVGEFKLQTSSFNAEYGRNPGVLISATTKSGGQQYHGTAYEFLRNDALDANLFFNNINGAKKAKLRFNQFGGNIGGPIYIPKLSTKDDKRLFFFFNYEGTRATRPQSTTATVNVLHPDMLNGDFKRLYRRNPDGSFQMIKGTNFPVGTVFQPGTVTRDSGGIVTGGMPFADNVIPRSLWSKNAQAFLKVLNSFDRSNGAPLAGTPEMLQVPYQEPYKFYKNQKAARIDWTLSSKANLFFRWVDDAQREDRELGIFTASPFPIAPQYREKPGSSWSWNLINVVSPNTTNEFIFTYNHLTQVVDISEGVPKDNYDRDALGFAFQEMYPESNTRNRYPRFNIGGNNGNFGAYPSNWVSEGKTFAFTDNATRMAGSHTFKFGGFFNMNLNGQQPAWTDSSSFDFQPNLDNANDAMNGLANMLLGNYTSLNQSNGRFYGSFRFFGAEAFAQDSWRINRRLTLDFGVRWAYMGPTYTYGKYLQNYFDPTRFDPSQAVQLDTSNTIKRGSIIPSSGDPFNGMVEEGSGIPKGFMKHRWNNFAPRFGFAYDVFGDGKMAIRGGAGAFYERIRQNQINFDGLGNPPLAYTPRVYSGNVDNVSPALIATGTRFPVGISGVESSGKIPTIYSWTVGIQRELPFGMSADVSYVGNTTRQLQYRMNLNTLPVGTTIQNPNLLKSVNNLNDAIRPYRGYQAINYTGFGANSSYHALQTRLSRRFGKDLTTNVNYTWSKAMDIMDNDGDTLRDTYNRQREYGPAGFDRTHTFTFDYVYIVPNLASSPVMKQIANGWQVTGMTRFWSGPPLNITSNGTTGTLGQGPWADYIGGDPYSNLPSAPKSVYYVNPFVFGRPVDGSLGNMGRNALRLAGINNWDISVFKTFQISERVRTQFRFETFNTFNHTQWGTINANVPVSNPGQAVTDATKGNLGTLQNTRDSRNVQLAMKLYF